MPNALLRIVEVGGRKRGREGAMEGWRENDKEGRSVERKHRRLDLVKVDAGEFDRLLLFDR